MTSFKFTGWVSPYNQTAENVTVFSGNFAMEVALPNSVKITNFEKLRSRLNVYVKQHMGKYPECIRVNKRQYHEYTSLFGKSVYVTSPTNKALSYNGVPLLLHLSLFKGFDALPNESR